jgi:ABC-type bacteriocin/lantibiotic exporter with double-glycine peptidase domain
MIGLLFVNALFDVFGIATILPLVNAALDPESVQTAWYLKIPYDFIGVEDHITFMFILSVIIFFVFVIKNLVSIFIFYIQAKFSFNISQRLSQNMFKHYYEQGFLYISNTESGKKNYDVITIPYYFSVSYLLETLLLATEILVLLIIFIAILFTNPSALIILLLVIFPVFLGVYLLTKNKTKAIGDQRNNLYPMATSALFDSFNAYVDVKLANKENYFYDNFRFVQREINDLDARQQGIYGKIHQRINDVVLGLALMGIFAFAYIFRESSSEVFALLTVFGLAAYRFLPSVNRIMGSALTLKNISYVINELKPIADKNFAEFKNVEKLKIKEKIRFDNVNYHYPGSDVTILKDLSMEIKVGETVGIIGSSGSGKTTFLNLFLRLLKETSGNIKVDGIPINEVNNASFQKTIGYVQQSVYIKNGTLKENVAFGEYDHEVDELRLNKAIKDAMLKDFVNNHSAGVMMPLGENGVMLSGGQRQRIGIARALYKDAEILLFDEATSALDPETEKAIVATIYNLTKLNKTIVIVAHRVTTLEMCDRIYDLKDGSVNGIYTYEQVINKVQNLVN